MAPINQPEPEVRSKDYIAGMIRGLSIHKLYAMDNKPLDAAAIEGEIAFVKTFTVRELDKDPVKEIKKADLTEQKAEIKEINELINFTNKLSKELIVNLEALRGTLGQKIS